jgi:hypothetical protein
VFGLIRRGRFTRLAVFGAAWLATVCVGGLLVSAASADLVIAGCTIVEHPTAQHHTVCPHANWRLRGDLAGVDLSHADLSDADLQIADLTGANLSGANLSKAVMSNARLIRANLSNARLIHASLRHADLYQANLSHADLIHADLQNASLHSTKLIHANLSNAWLVHANLTFADLLHAQLPPDTGGDLSQLRGAYFCHTTMPDGHVNNSRCDTPLHTVDPGAAPFSGRG